MTKIPRFLGGAGVLALAFVIVGLRAQREPREQQFRDDRQHVTEPGDPALRDRMMKGYALVRKGKAALAENDLRNAESVFREVLSLDRTNTEGWAGLAETLDKQGKTSEAIVVYRTLTNPGPKWGNTLASDPAVLMRYAVLLTRANQGLEAVPVYEKAANGVSSCAQASKNKQDTKGKEVIVRSAVVRPYDPKAAARERQYERLLGLGYRSLKDDPQKAEGYLRQSLPLSIVPDDALYGLALALEQQGKTGEALLTYRSLTTPNTSWDSTLKREPQVLLRYSLIAAQKGTWPEAVAAYETAAGRLNEGRSAALPPLPTNFSPQMRRAADLAAMAHVGLGMALAKRGKNDEALAEFAHAAKLRPNAPVAQFYHGYGLKAAGRTAEAKSAFARAAASGRGALKTAAEKELR